MLRAAARAGVVLSALAVAVSGCDSDSPTEPQQAATPPEVGGTITFAGAGPANAPIASYAEAGFVVQFRAGTWTSPVTLAPGGEKKFGNGGGLP